MKYICRPVYKIGENLKICQDIYNQLAFDKMTSSYSGERTASSGNNQHNYI